MPSLVALAKKLTASDIEQILRLKRVAPLEAEREKIIGELAKLDKQIAALGGEAPKVPGKRGRKPGRPAKGKPGRKRGRPAKTASAPAKRGRPTKGKPGRKRGRPVKAAATPTKRGPGRPPKVKPVAKVGRPRKRPALTGPAREAMLERMAKARAAMAAKRAAAAEAKA